MHANCGLQRVEQLDAGQLPTICHWVDAQITGSGP